MKSVSSSLLLFSSLFPAWPRPRNGGRGFSYLSSLLAVALSLTCNLTLAGESPAWWERAAVIAQKEGYRLIDKKELKALYQSNRLFGVIDVRSDYEYAAGRLPKAVWVGIGLEDRSFLSPEKRNQLEAALGSDLSREIVIYCKNYT